jgi:imidazolonepropionase-like amidohydrolase
MSVTLRAALIGLVAAGAALAVAVAHQTSPTTLVKFGQLWDGTRLITNATVVIDGTKITRVETDNVRTPAGATVIDLTRYTGLPGLIDLHTHMTYGWDHAPNTTPLQQGGQRDAATRLELAYDNAKKTLESGVTTVRDLGASGGMDYTMRDAINAGTRVGPRMFVAGSGLSAPRGNTPNTLDQWRQAVATRVTAGSDWIKVYGSRGSFQSVDTTQTLTYEEMKAIVDAAHGLKHPVAIHSYGASGVKDAVRAGADSVEHGIELDDETIKDMAARGTVWVPTIDHNRYYVDAKDEYRFAPETIPPLQAYIEANLAATARAVKAGVKIGMGSDAVYTMFGQNTRELGWLVKAGMTPAQALGSATTIGAALLGQSTTLGQVAPGFFADIVAVEGDPLQSIDNVYNVRWVMKNGKVVVEK